MKKPKSAGKLRTKIIWAVLILTVALIITPWGRAFYKTLIILPEFIPNSPIKTAGILTRKPIIKEVEFKSEDRTIYADIWYPNSQGKHPAAVLSLGVDIDRKDERAQKLANVFARSGIITLVPNIPSLGRRRVLAEAKNDLVASFEYAKSLQNTKQDKVGFIGFCASGGLVLLASEDTKIAENVTYVVTVNPYFNLSNLYKNITLRQIEDNGKTYDWNPNFKTIEIYNRETIEGIKSAKDRKILYDRLIILDIDKLETEESPPLTQEEINQLSDEALFTYDALINKDPTKVSYYLENINDAQKEFLKDLSPSTNIDNLKAQTFILVDVNNVFTPYTEAELLDRALTGKDHIFVKTQLLPAGNLVKNLSITSYPKEIVKIFKFVYSILWEIS